MNRTVLEIIGCSWVKCYSRRGRPFLAHVPSAVQRPHGKCTLIHICHVALCCSPCPGTTVDQRAAAPGGDVRHVLEALHYRRSGMVGPRLPALLVGRIPVSTPSRTSWGARPCLHTRYRCLLTGTPSPPQGPVGAVLATHGQGLRVVVLHAARVLEQLGH